MIRTSAGGTSQDCNGNTVPDECDLVDGSEDLNGNDIPDECERIAPLPEDSLATACTIDDECHGEARCVQGMCYAPKHRYLSVVRHPDQLPDTARRIRLQDGTVLGWLGAPYDASGLTVADVVDAPVYQVVWPDVVHACDCEIATGHLYEVQAIRQGVTVGNEVNYSAPLLLHTPSAWGDVVSTCFDNLCLPADGAVGVDDILAIIVKFQGIDNAPLTWLDIDANQGIGVADILGSLGGFQGDKYPGADPLDCP